MSEKPNYLSALIALVIGLIVDQKATWFLAAVIACGMLADRVPSVVLPLQILAWPLAIFLIVTVFVDIPLHIRQMQSPLPPPESGETVDDWNKKSNKIFLGLLAGYSWSVRIITVILLFTWIVFRGE